MRTKLPHPVEGTETIRSFGRRLNERDCKLVEQVLTAYNQPLYGENFSPKNLALAQIKIPEKAFWGRRTTVRRKKPHNRVVAPKVPTE